MKLELLNKKYTSKTAFITGAGSGLGAAFAKLLAKNGWTLHLSDINLPSLEGIKGTFVGAAAIHTYHQDVTDQLVYEKVVNAICEKNEIEVVINNAGIGDGELIQNYAPENWIKMVNINLLGTYYGCHYFVPQMIARKRGLIINIGSAAGFMNAPGMSAYNATKAAVYSLSETLYHELKPNGIHVSVVTPTFFKTNIMSDATGSGKFVAFAQKQMHYSKTNADEMAEVVLTSAAKGKFQIIHPADARKNHFMKKWFPGLVSKQFEKMIAKFSR